MILIIFQKKILEFLNRIIILDNDVKKDDRSALRYIEDKAENIIFFTYVEQWLFILLKNDEIFSNFEQQIKGVI